MWHDVKKKPTRKLDIGEITQNRNHESGEIIINHKQLAFCAEHYKCNEKDEEVSFQWKAYAVSDSW